MAAPLVLLPPSNLPARVIITEHKQPIFRLVSRSALELVFVAALVFALGWIGVRVAELLHRLPVHPNGKGNIELPIVKSDRRGNVTFEEGFSYKGWWHCQGNDWAVDWKFVAEARRYRVRARVASPEQSHKTKIALVIGGKKLEAEAPETGGPDDWKNLALGTISLEKKSYILTVCPATSDGQALMNLKSVSLSPE
jgi:hypothetical protein